MIGALVHAHTRKVYPEADAAGIKIVLTDLARTSACPEIFIRKKISGGGGKDLDQSMHINNI